MKTLAEIETVRERLVYAVQAAENGRNLLLHPDEVDLLDRILSNYLLELHSEIGHTDSYEMRQALKRDRVVVAGLVAQLRSPADGAATARAD